MAATVTRIPSAEPPTESRYPGVSTFGWSDAKKRKALAEVREVLVAQGMTKTAAAELIAANLGIGVNTVQGWFSDPGAGRKLPIWEKIDLLRYRTGLAQPEPLKPPRKRRS